MKTKFYYLACLLLLQFAANAQMKIGNNPTTINSASLLELETTDKGLVFPRVSLTNVTSSSPLAATLLTGTVVYNTNASVTGGNGIGLYYWGGSVWTSISSSAVSTNWSLTGNSGLNASTNFIGTTDAIDFVVKTANTERMRILGAASGSSKAGWIGMGVTIPRSSLDVAGHYSNKNVLTLQNTSTSGFSSVDMLDSLGNLKGTFGYANAGTGGLFAGKNYFNIYGNDFIFTSNSSSYDWFMKGSNGFVGINTNSPTERLHVAGNLYLTGAFMPGGLPGTSGYILASSGAGVAPVWSNLSGLAWSLTGNSGTSYVNNFLGTADNVSMRFRTNNIQRTIIDSLGRVGIGLGNPSYALSVLSASNPVYLSGVQATSTFTADSILTINAGVVKKAPYSSLTGNFWNLTGNSGTSYVTNFLGTTDNISLRFRTNNAEKVIIDSLGSVGIGSSTFNATSREKLLVDYGTTTSNTLATFRGSIDDFFQINLQNKSSGVNASTDYVATSDDGTDSTYYVDMGINSSTYAPGVENFGGPHDAYLYAASRNLLIGAASTNSDIIFLLGGGKIRNNAALRLNGADGNIIVGGGESSTTPIGNVVRGPNAGSGSTNIAGGGLTLQGGSATTTATGGSLNIYGGTSASGTAGAVNINTGNKSATNINTGTSTSNTSIGSTGNNIILPKYSAAGGIFYTSLATGQIATTGSNMTWDSINNRLGIGIASPGYKLSVLAASDPLYLSGVQATSTFTADSVLTINAGVVKKSPYTALNNGFWSLNGNAGTNAATNFLGTTDNVALSFRVNNLTSGKIDPGGALFLGYQTGNSNTAATIAGLGWKAMYSNTSGADNIAVGYASLFNNTTGSSNAALGYQALYLNTTGTWNTGTGSQTLYSNTSGNYNTANGYRALYANTTGTSNTGIGAFALLNNTTASGNTSVGNASMYTNTTGNNNTALGTATLNTNSTGSNNLAAGHTALTLNTTGNNNIAAGYQTMYNNTTGGNNTATGIQALTNNTTASSNTAYGYRAAYNNTTGGNNTAVGYNALLSNVTGNNNMAIGYGADVASNNLTNATAIGYNAKVSASNSLVFGGASDPVNIGIGTTAPTYKLTVLSSTDPLYLSGVQATSSFSSDSILTINAGVVKKAAYSSLNGAGNWSLTGNSGTSYASNFLGTIDNISLRFRTNNVQRMIIDSLGKVGIGTSSPASDLTLYQSSGSGNSKGFTFTGNSIGSTNTGTGFLMSLGYNTTGNKQLWLGDADYAGNSSGSFARFVTTGTAFPVIDAVSGDNASRRYIAFGVTGDANSGVIFGNDNTSVNPGSQVWDNGNMSIGAGYKSYGAPSNGLLVQGNVGIGTASPSNALSVSSTNPLYLAGVQATSTVSADSVLTINAGVVKKAPYSAYPGGSGWSLTGNSGTTAGTNFLGTTDAQPLVIKSLNRQLAYFDGNLYSIALGFGAANNSSDHNIAIGYNATTNNQYALALGYSATASGVRSIAIGNGGSATTASNAEAIAIGYNATASGVQSTAIGYTASATGSYGIGIGYGSQANTNADVIAIGHSSVAIAQYATAIGYTASATGLQSTAIGYRAQTSQSNTILLGDAATNNLYVGIGTATPSAKLEIVGTSGNNPLEMSGLPAGVSGTDNLLTINSSGVVGYVTPASFNSTYWTLSGNAAASGNFLGTTNATALQFKYNSTLAGNLDANNTAFGTSSSSTSGTSNTAIGYSATASNSATAIGANAAATQANTTAIGNSAIANTTQQATAIGASSQALYQYNVAVGYNAQATLSSQETVIGSSAQAQGQNNIAVGYLAKANGSDKITVIGSSAQGSFQNNTVVGNSALATVNSQATAIGASSAAGAQNATALGYNASASGANSTAIGASATTSQANAIVLGTSTSNVGIGTATPNTSAKLDVAGNFKLGSGGSLIKNISTGSVAINSTITSGSFTDLTITLSSTLSSTTGAVNASPNFDLPTGIIIAFARIISTTQVKVRVYNASFASQTVTGNIYATATEF